MILTLKMNWGEYTKELFIYMSWFKIVGHCYVKTFHKKPSPKLFSLYVHEKYRGKGIGTKLREHAEQKYLWEYNYILIGKTDYYINHCGYQDFGDDKFYIKYLWPSN